MTGVVPFGDRALLATLGDAVDEELVRRVHVLAARIAGERTVDDAWGTPVPGYATVLAPFDPARLDPADAAASLAVWLADALATDLPPETDSPVLDIPVRYGGEDGPDLGAVAERLGMAERAVVEAHAGHAYRVFLLGFAPGFGYLGPLPAALELPRRSEPRTRVPPGSVAIAARQTAVYPFATPGGWHLIGRTSLRMWDVRRDPPALLRAGSRVRFVPGHG